MYARKTYPILSAGRFAEGLFATSCQPSTTSYSREISLGQGAPVLGEFKKLTDVKGLLNMDVLLNREHVEGVSSQSAYSRM